MACAREAEHLMSLSDAQLAEHALSRDQVFRHAFRNHIGA